MIAGERARIDGQRGEYAIEGVGQAAVDAAVEAARRCRRKVSKKIENKCITASSVQKRRGIF